MGSQLSEAFDRGRNWDVHRVRWTAECKPGGRQSRYSCQSGQFPQSGIPTGMFRISSDADPDDAKDHRRDLDRRIRHNPAGNCAWHVELARRGLRVAPSLEYVASTYLRGALHLGLFEIIFVFLFVDLFDNVGTLVGVCEQGGFVKDGNIRGWAARWCRTPWVRSSVRSREHPL